jgi:DNA-binding LacI/PurR family transcriptional regulator
VGLFLQSGENFEEKVAPSLTRHQLQCPPYWLHRVLPESATTVTSIVHLMMRHPAERPQGLIIADDHFTGPATLGLLAAGVRVPDELEVVVHENFPAQSQSLLPFKRLGFDVRELLRTCIELIDQERQGGSPRLVSASALFEDELPEAHPTSA